MNHRIFFSSEVVELKNCDKEPIDIAGLVQAHGIIFVLQEPKLNIIQVSNNTFEHLGIHPQDILGKQLKIFFNLRQISLIKKALSEQGENINPFYLSTKNQKGQLFFYACVHRAHGVIILELEQVTSKENHDFLSFYHLVQPIMVKMQKALTLSDLCEVIVQEVRKITGFDRVMVYQFDSEGAGTVIAEDKLESLSPFLGLHYSPIDIFNPAKQLYTLNPLQLIPDVNYQPVELIPIDNPVTNQRLDLSFSILRSFSPIYIKYLQSIGVAAFISILLIRDNKLWGLIICHHQSPKYVPYKVRLACQMLGKVMSLELVYKEDNQYLDYKANVLQKADKITKMDQQLTLALEAVDMVLHRADEIANVNQQLTLALEAADMGIWNWDVLANRVVWSSSQEQLFGFAPKAFLETYEAVMACIHPDDIESVSLAVKQARIEQQNYYQEFRIVWSDNSIHWVEAKGRFIYNDEGQAVRMLGTVMEISDRKARVEQLRLLESVIIHTNETVLITEAEPNDATGPRIIYANPAFSKITGYTLESVLGKTPHFLHGEKTDQAALDKIGKALQNWQSVSVDLINYTKDGRELWVEVNLFPVADETGRFTHWVSVGRDITERKQAEVALRESEERFRQLAENIQDIFWIGDPKTRQIVYVSPAYEKIWGRKRESLYANSINWMNSIHPDDRERIQAAAEGNVESAHQGSFENEYRIVRPDGTVRWIRDRGFVIEDELGQVQRVIGIAQDITDRKLAAATLQQLNEELEIRVKQRTFDLERSQAILQQQVEREQVMVRITQQIRQSLDLTTILNTIVTEVQKLLAADRVVVYRFRSDGTGYTIAEAVRGEWTSILHYIFSEESLPGECCQRYIEGRIYTLSDRNKDEIVPCMADFFAHIQVRAALVVPINQQGNLWGLLIAHQCSEPRKWQPFEMDLLQQLANQLAIAIQQSELYQQLEEELRERQHAEVALRQSENLFRSVSEFLPVGIFRGDTQGKNVYTNPRYQAICGCTFEEALGYGWQQFIHPNDLQAVSSEWTAATAANQEFCCEVRYVHRDGTIRLCRVTMVPIFSESGELKGRVGMLEDITESRAIEKMKDEFISIVSHELRTPLASIRGSLGLLASGVLKDQPETVQQMLQIAASDTKRLVRLVNEILNLERLEANNVSLVKHWCDAATLMQKSVETMGAMATQSNIKPSILPTSVSVWADPDWIIQALVNLLSNAIKFSPPASTVTLSALALPDWVLFKVQDRGRGIPNDKLETIFDRFQQIDASDSRQKGGTGLGLAICRSIVQKHGGRIWAESVLGLGSTFYFTLPTPLES